MHGKISLLRSRSRAFSSAMANGKIMVFFQSHEHCAPPNIDTGRGQLVQAFTPCIMCVQYRGGAQYRGGCSVPWGDIMSTWGIS